MSWEDVDPEAGAEVFDLDLSREAVRTLRRDPQVDITPTAEDRGGIFIRPAVNAEVWDSDTSTVWAASRYLCAEIAEGNYFLYCTDDFGTEGTANIDLGGTFQIDRIQVISGLRDPARTVQALRIFMAFELPFTSVTHHPRPWSPWIAEVRDNRAQVLDISLPPNDGIGYVQVTLGEHDSRYLQFLVDFLPLESDGGEVSFLEFRASEPVAKRLVGEVWPAVARVGDLTEFTYALLPTIASTDAGFDRVEIQSLSILGEIQEVRVGDVVVSHTVEAAESNRLAVAKPPLDSGDTGALVEVDFTAQVLRYGAEFELRVWNSEQPLEVPQAADPGNATGEFEGNGTTVATSDADQGELLHVRVDHEVLTPNGDGTNDQARLAYEILEITGEAAVRVEIADISGRRVRLLHAESQEIGTYEQTWDGCDESDRVVPPGIYLYSVEIASDREEIRKMGLLHVAY